MGTAEHMDMILVRATCFHLNRKPIRNLGHRFLGKPGPSSSSSALRYFTGTTM